MSPHLLLRRYHWDSVLAKGACFESPTHLGPRKALEDQAAHRIAILFIVSICVGGKTPAEEIVSSLEEKHLCGRSLGTSRWQRLLLVASYCSIRWFFTVWSTCPVTLARAEGQQHRPPSRFDTRHLISKLSDKAHFFTEKQMGFLVVLFCFVCLTNQTFPPGKEKCCTLQVFRPFKKSKKPKST